MLSLSKKPASIMIYWGCIIEQSVDCLSNESYSNFEKSYLLDEKLSHYPDIRATKHKVPDKDASISKQNQAMEALDNQFTIDPRYGY